MPTPDDNTPSRRSDQFALRLTLGQLFAELAPLHLERTRAMRRLAAAGAVVAAGAADGGTLATISDALDDLYAEVPHDDAWEARSRLLEQIYDQVAELWAPLLAGEREAA